MELLIMDRWMFIIAALFAVMWNTAVVLGQECVAGSAMFINGNWYCQPVKAITYRNFPGTGDYNKIVAMDEDTGHCQTERYDYSGSLSPLNEELSIHVRGPTWLHRLAVYVPAKTSHERHHAFKAGVGDHSHGHHHIHRHVKAVRGHQEHDAPSKRAVGDLVIATINDQRVSWINSYSGPPAPAPAAVPSSIVSQPAADDVYEIVIATTFVTVSAPCPTTEKTSAPQQTTAPSKSKVVSSATDKVAHTHTGSWTRQAYYNAESGYSKGFTFLNHHGGTNGLSGTSDGGHAFGASLAYASYDAKTAAGSSQILKNAMLPDGVEIAILSDRSCDDGGCGFTRPDTVAYHGFGGSSKIFLMQFTMPFTGTRGFNGDMPAIWLLNAQIPRTSQYGTNPNCSCWTTGCGELDLFEVLDPGNFRCKSTLHMAPAGGCSEYFVRPSEAPLTAAVVFSGTKGVVSIRVLEEGDGATFGEDLDGQVVEAWLEGVVDGLGDEWSVFDLKFGA